MAQKKLTDPVDAGKEEAINEAEFESLDISKIKVEVLPDEAAKAVHPFDGYPTKKIKMNMPEKDRAGKKVMTAKTFNLTHWVLHNHIGDPIHQDPSNRSRKTYHSRSIPDVLGGNSVPNISIQFCTLIDTADGQFYGALVPDCYIRSQLIFMREPKTGNIKIDKRYMLLDPEQAGRLKKAYFQLMKPTLDMERAADQITAGEEPTAIREIAPGQEL
jgi:hypothetical protein